MTGLAKSKLADIFHVLFSTESNEMQERTLDHQLEHITIELEKMLEIQKGVMIAFGELEDRILELERQIDQKFS